MHVLVTGGLGYIGQVLSRMLLDSGHRVRILDTNEFHAGLPEGAEVIHGDIRSAAFHPEWFADIDGIAHLAGLSNDPTADFRPEYAFDVNVDGTIAVAKQAIAHRITRFTFASSASVYDRAETSDEPEMQTERGQIAPLGSYSLSKFHAESALRRLAAVHDGFQPTLLRQATVYGNSPRMRFDLVVNTMTRAALATGVIQQHGDRQTWRPLISVRNCARAHMIALTASIGLVGNRTFNVAEGNFPISFVAEAVAVAANDAGVPCWCDVVPMPADRRARNYRMSTERWDAALPTFENEIVREVQAIARAWRGLNLFHPLYDNMATMAKAAALA